MKPSRRAAALAGLLALGLILWGPAILSLARLNAGMIALSRAWMAKDGRVVGMAALQAESQLRWVTRQSPENRSAWRGLGLALARQGSADGAVAAWGRAPGMVSDLMLWGRHAFLTERYQEALQWYQWAARLEPVLAGPWYYTGRVHEELQQWQEALRAYEHVLELDDWSGFRRSSLHYHTGRLYSRPSDDQDLERAWQAFEAAVQAGDFDDPWECSDCHFERGMVLMVWERPVGEYLAEFERAVAIQPAHAGAHTQLGWAYYVRDQDLQLAEEHLLEAMALDRRDGWPYVVLGDVYTGAGMRDQAAQMYEQALQFENVHDQAQERLQGLLQPSGVQDDAADGGS